MWLFQPHPDYIGIEELEIVDISGLASLYAGCQVGVDVRALEYVMCEFATVLQVSCNNAISGSFTFIYRSSDETKSLGFVCDFGVCSPWF